MGRHRAGLVGAVEWVRCQDRGRAASVFDPSGCGDRGEEQPLARAVEHQHLGCRVDRARQPVAAAEPLRRRQAELVEPLVHRVLAEFGDMGGQNWANECRHGVLRFADREADGRPAGRQVAKQFAQPDEG